MFRWLATCHPFCTIEHVSAMSIMLQSRFSKYNLGHRMVAELRLGIIFRWTICMLSKINSFPEVGTRYNWTQRLGSMLASVEMPPKDYYSMTLSIADLSHSTATSGCARMCWASWVHTGASDSTLWEPVFFMPLQMFPKLLLKWHKDRQLAQSSAHEHGSGVNMAAQLLQLVVSSSYQMEKEWPHGKRSMSGTFIQWPKGAEMFLTILSNSPGLYMKAATKQNQTNKQKSA